MAGRGAELLLAPLSELHGVGATRISQFTRLGIETIGDLIYYAPRDYVDFSQISEIAKAKPGKVTFKAALAQPIRDWRRGRRHISEAIFDDGSGQVKAFWFNQPYRKFQLRMDRQYMVSGELSFYGSGYSLTHPSVERVEASRLSTGMIVSRYPQTKGLNSRAIRAAQQKALDLLDDEVEIYPPDFAKEQKLKPLKTALKNLHFPETEAESKSARARLSFDELFALQLAGQLAKLELATSPSPKINFDEKLAKVYVKSLGFELTGAQRRSAWEIVRDLDSVEPMNRMLEGDVGSGKTVVAALAMLMSAKAGFQSVLLAPTTILASQHQATLSTLLKPFDLDTRLLTRHTPAKEATQIRADLRSGKRKIVVGTHALLSKQTDFKSLGLAIIDEQHRFGVEQRSRLRSASKLVPHVLTMTATPIPRSLALTLYGELDLSILDEMPPGRQPIKTEIYGYGARTRAYQQVLKELKQSRQAYIVTPRIEDKDENMASVEKVSRELGAGLLKGRKLAVLHGKMKADQKDAIMQSFYKGEVEALISTTVVEVGLDNPNATVMVIEGADRFGLAQLHQLRGRVGRGSDESYCLLIGSPDSEPTRRLHAMATTNDGFKLATLDLKLRGPGALYGTRQHGLIDLNIADITDLKSVQAALGAARDFIKADYSLSGLPILKARVDQLSRESFLN